MSAFDPLAIGANKPNQSSSYSTVPTSHCLPALGLDENQVQFLEQQGFSSGLIRALDTCRHSHPRRMWILDNSKSMNIRDSHRIGGNFTNLQNMPGTRWEELQDCVAYHAQISALFHMPTKFALVNKPGIMPQYFGVAENATSIAQEMQTLKNVMVNTRPDGPTPLSGHIAQLRQHIVSIAPNLNGQIVTVVLATQGLPTNEKGEGGPSVIQHFVQTLRSLEGLPVWVVVRLCTDDEQVFDFYNSLDSQFNLPYDVLDDYFGESLEVYLRNPWLTYALPLHRFREFGFKITVLDTIDERALTKAEVRDLCCLLFSVNHSDLPDPTTHWEAFFQLISGVAVREKQQWNPITRKVCPWINLHDLNALYGGNKNMSQLPLFNRYQQPVYQEHSAIPSSTASSNHFAPQHNRSPPMQQPQVHQGSAPYHQPNMQQQHFSRTYVDCHGQFVQQPKQQPPPKPKYTARQETQQRQQTARAPTSTGYDETNIRVPTSNDIADVKKQILTSWALAPPQYMSLRPIDYLLGTVHQTFPPSFGIEQHDYFQKWKPFSVDALSSRQEAVLKRAVRKIKVFLHPDKLPKDFTEKQTLLCKILWDVTADAWEEFGKS